MTKEVLLERAKRAVETGSYANASKLFLAAIELDPRCAEAWYGRAGVLFDTGSYRAAIEAFERSRQLDSPGHSAIALFGVGNCWVKLGERLRAVRYFDEALQEAPRLERVWHNRGTALFELQLYEEAAASYSRELELKPSNIKSQVWRTRCLERLGRPAPVPEQNCDPREVATAWMEIATHEYEASDVQHALNAYERAAAAQPTLGHAWVGQGACLARLGQSHAALQALDRAVALDDDSRSMALAYRSAILKSMVGQDEKEGEYERMLRSDPGSVEDLKAKAFGLYVSERYEEALGRLQALERKQPQFAETWYVKGLCLDALGRFAEAAAAFSEFVQRKPDNARGWFRLARALTAIGRADQAVECCQKAIGLGFTTAESWLQEGITLAQLERYGEAVPCMDKALHLKQGWDEALYNRGVCHYYLSDLESAMTDLNAVMEQGTPSPHSIMALYFLEQALSALGQITAAQSCQLAAKAYTALAEGRFEDSVQLFRNALTVDNTNAAASMRLAAWLVERGDLQEGSGQLGQALSLRPHNVELWSTRGAVLARLGRNAEALVCYGKALELDPLHLPALRNSAITLVETGELQEALNRYERALQLEDRNVNAWYGRGVCLARMSRWEDAVQAFRRAVELAPSDADAWHDLGSCLVEVGNYKEALAAWQMAARLEPGLALAENIRQLQLATDNSGQVRFLSVVGYDFFSREDFAQAAQWFDAALELDPQHDGLWNDRGICAEHLEGPERAIEYFDRALALAPDKAQIWYNKAVSLQHLRRLPNAIAAFEKVVRIHQSKELPIDEDLLHSCHNLASCLILMGKIEEALDQCDEVLLLARENRERWQEESRRARSLKEVILAQGQARLA